MSATYDEVANWWDNSEYHMSTYPPSAWHAYCEKVGLSIEELTADPGAYESEVEELHEAGDGRKCECEWAEHERGCKDPAAELGHS
jgi:hypothetical protein